MRDTEVGFWVRGARFVHTYIHTYAYTNVHAYTYTPQPKQKKRPNHTTPHHTTGVDTQGRGGYQPAGEGGGLAGRTVIIYTHIYKCGYT